MSHRSNVPLCYALTKKYHTFFPVMKTLNSTKIKQTLLLFLLICTAFIFTGITAKAQETYSIKGTVSDEKGETLPGATAFLAN